MTTRSSRLVAFRSTGTREALTLYTSPPGIVTLVKAIQVFTESGTAHRLQIYAQDSASGPLGFLVNQELASDSLINLQFWQVLEPGDTLHGSFVVPGDHVWISGALLPVSA